MHPTVSVVMPVYNCEAYVGDALQSILDQTCDDFEVIAVNDGSKDGSVAAIRPFLRDSRIRLVEQENAGASVARNTGIGLASGRYIAFLDADDLWVPNKLETQLAYFDAHPNCSLVHGGIEGIDEQGQPLPLAQMTWFAPDQQAQATGRCFDKLFFHCHILLSTVMLKREVFLTTGMFRPDLRISHDWDLWLRISRGHEIGYVAETFAYYRRHGASLTTNWLRIDQENVLFLEDILAQHPSIPEEIGAERVATRLHELHKLIARELGRRNDHRAARPHWRKALAYRAACLDCYSGLLYASLPDSLRRFVTWQLQKLRAGG